MGVTGWPRRNCGMWRSLERGHAGGPAEAVASTSMGPGCGLVARQGKKESNADEGRRCAPIHADGSVRFKGRAPRA